MQVSSMAKVRMPMRAGTDTKASGIKDRDMGTAFIPGQMVTDGLATLRMIKFGGVKGQTPISKLMEENLLEPGKAKNSGKVRNMTKLINWLRGTQKAK